MSPAHARPDLYNNIVTMYQEYRRRRNFCQFVTCSHWCSFIPFYVVYNDCIRIVWCYLWFLFVWQMIDWCPKTNYWMDPSVLKPTSRLTTSLVWITWLLLSLWSTELVIKTVLLWHCLMFTVWMKISLDDHSVRLFVYVMKTWEHNNIMWTPSSLGMYNVQYLWVLAKRLMRRQRWLVPGEWCSSSTRPC